MNYTREQISEIAYIKDSYKDNFIDLIRQILNDVFEYEESCSASFPEGKEDPDNEGQEREDDFDMWFTDVRHRYYKETPYLLKVDIVRQFGFNRALTKYQECFSDDIPDAEDFVQYLFAHCVFDFTFKKSLYDIVYNL